MTPPDCSRFVGRAEELGRLLALLERVEQGHPAVALVAGDAGVGKTRLLGELTARAEDRGVRVLVGGCMEAGDLGLPYVPFIDAFRGLGGRPGEGEAVSELVRAVPNLGRLLLASNEPPANSDDGFEQVQLFDGVLSLLVKLSELVPLLLVVEDVHWADRSTRDLLAFLVRTLRRSRIGIVATYRSDELHRRHPLRPLLAELLRVQNLERLEVAPFGWAELREWLEALAGERVPPSAVDRILARSEGNPFFAEELVAAGAIRAEVLLPATLTDVLLQRIEALSDLAQEVLKVAAVAGRRVHHGLLVTAAGLPEDELERGLREAIAGQVLVADPVTESYRFRHALLQEVVYGDLLPGERRRLHATYARLLAGAGLDGAAARGSAAELAHHCLASHELPTALAALVRAAGEAAAVAAPAEALRHLGEAIELWDRVPDPEAAAGARRDALFLQAAQAASDSGELRRAVTLGREAVAAIDVASDPLAAAAAYERLGAYLLEADVDGEEVVATCRLAVELVPPSPATRLRARVTAGLGRALLSTREYDEARRWSNEALAVAREAGSASEETHALITLAMLAQRHDEEGTARSLLREALALAAASRDPASRLRAQCNLGSLELDVGDLGAACIALEAAVALAEQSGLRWSPFGVEARVLRCFAFYAFGAWDEAERAAGAPDDGTPSDGPVQAAALFVVVGRGGPRAGELLRAIDSYWSDDDWVGYLTAGCAADLARWEGDLDQARERVDARLKVLDAADEPWALSGIWLAALGVAAEADRAEQAREAGDQASLTDAVTAGRALLDRATSAVRWARSVGRQVGPEALGWLARTEAEFARLEGRPDPDRWSAAADAFAFGYVYEEARSRWRLAEALLALGRRDEALVATKHAHGVAVRLGAEPLRAAVEALARRARFDIGAGATQPSGGAGLTAREVEVLRLVAAGRSNQQIAESLFISRKTASVHVSNIMRKLGVRSRGEAAAVAHRLAIDGDPVLPVGDEL